MVVPGSLVSDADLLVCDVKMVVNGVVFVIVVVS